MSIKQQFIIVDDQSSLAESVKPTLNPAEPKLAILFRSARMPIDRQPVVANVACAGVVSGRSLQTGRKAIGASLLRRFKFN